MHSLYSNLISIIGIARITLLCLAQVSPLRRRKNLPFKILLHTFASIIIISAAFSSIALGEFKSAIQVSKTPKPKPKPSTVVSTKSSPNAYHEYELAITLAEIGEWKQLSKFNLRPTHKGLEDVLFWLRLTNHGPAYEFSEIKNFLARRPIWPERNKVIRIAESLVDETVPPIERDKWFSKYRPHTPNGKLEWINTLEILNETERRDSLILKTWLNTRLTRRSQSRLRRVYPNIIDKNANWARLDNFLWQGRTRSAQKMYPLVNKDQILLAEARLRLRHMTGGVDAAINRVPLYLRDNPGLVYERLRWRNRKGMDKKARELLVNVQRNQTFPKLWWRERSRQIRSALSAGEYNEAYKLALDHIQTNHYTKTEADWTAGWIALRYADKPIEAARYFTIMYNRVKTPLSKSRAAYWAGRAFQAALKTGVSNSWYNIASNYQTTFYGQLAQKALLVEFSHSPSPPISKIQYDDGIDIKFYIETITALHSINKNRLARKFLKALALSNISKENFIRVATLSNQIGYRDMSVYIARKAAKKGIFLMDIGYPIIKLPYKSGVEPALILSVIRQESNFDKKAKSRRGAMGYMQLMPKTAKEIGKILKVNFTLAQLKENPTLNIVLGSEYLRRLLEKFDGSYVLALAAYNAGPLNVKRWMKNAGDPRKIEVDVIDWVERIPFRETRNYVQRVLENVTVYRRLYKTHVKQTARPESYWRPLGQHMSP